MQATRGVYFFDEFDTTGARRVEQNDVGEIRRALNSIEKASRQAAVGTGSRTATSAAQVERLVVASEIPF